MPTANKIFIFDKIRIFFKHTDYYGCVHPYNYLEWTSYVREAFFSEICRDFKAIIESKVKMMTSKINLSMYEDGIFGDSIEARFMTSRIKKVSFDVIVQFFNARLGKISAETQHTLVFMDSSTGQFTAIPESLKDVIGDYLAVEQETE